MYRKKKVAIIGAGPAGIAAAVQLKRSGITPLLFEGEKPGGLLNNARCVENYPGFPRGISGPALVRRFVCHLREWSINVISEKVVEVVRQKNFFLIQTRKKYYSEILIIASGTEPKSPDPSLLQLDDSRIFFDIIRLRRMKNKKILIVGAGDAAFDYALNLGSKNRVIVINRKREIKALPLLYKRIRSCDYRNQITYFPHTRLLNFIRKGDSLVVELLKKNKEISLVCDYLLFAIGRQPSLGFLSPSLLKKYPGGDDKLYFIGDVKAGRFRQAAIAVGDGIEAAMRIAARLGIGERR
ncbi:MAG TPA: NAD(P)/FAD-dependent oxidoreductase [candidate division WOR-3 bacterium]|uniref:NAD(P)/FAD-dependent oxidoreductase n=2 Tax=candidate division WOR-3 bacterium TaxID=2052148 RepID=A0A9C9JZB1_UNCW3|nr:NAD(P)/FAD-dependent oxidoreductase [candidate division WOR-3 bacterium]